MTLGCKDMHTLAQRMAVNIGPRVMNVRGEFKTVFGLSKAEARKLFNDSGYNVTTGSRWRSVISDWADPELFGDVVTADRTTLLNKNEVGNWCVVFMNLNKDEVLDLQFKAEETNYPTMPSVKDIHGVATCRT